MNFLIVIPVYKQFHHLARCLDSVFPQLGFGDQVVVVCEHEEFAAMQQFQQVNDRRHPLYIVSDRDTRWGVARARNEGVKQAAPGVFEWVKFLDADDVLAPFALETFRRTGLPEHIMVVAGGMYKVVNEKLGDPRLHLTNWRLLAEINPSLVSACMVRRSAFEAVEGFDPEIGFEEDWDFWLRIALKFHRPFAMVQWPMCYYWIHAGERAEKVRDHTVPWKGERLDVREFLRRKYQIDPV